jgi:hypothetical protein
MLDFEYFFFSVVLQPHSALLSSFINLIYRYTQDSPRLILHNNAVSGLKTWNQNVRNVGHAVAYSFLVTLFCTFSCFIVHSVASLPSLKQNALNLLKEGQNTIH